MSKIYEKLNFLDIQNSAISTINFVEGQIMCNSTFVNQPRGCSMSVRRTSAARTIRTSRITDREGKDIIKISAVRTNPTSDDCDVIALLKTNTLEVAYEFEKKVILSMLDGKGAVREMIIFTPEGKRRGMSSNSGSFVLKPLEPITNDDALFVCERLSKSIEMPSSSVFKKLQSSLQRVHRLVTR